MPAEVVEWGLVPYPEALERMRELRRRRARGEVPDTLILVRHPPILTVGVQGTGGEPLPPGLPVFTVERGGHATYHDPGQWVGYPIVDLNPRGRDVRRFVHELEEMVCRAVAPLGVQAGRRPGERGVWVGGARKLASVGVAVEEWVTSHGFALNVSTDLRVFRSFKPCGLEGDVMTSLREELGRPVDLEGVRPLLLEAWNEVFGGLPRPPGAAPLAPPRRSREDSDPVRAPLRPI